MATSAAEVESIVVRLTGDGSQYVQTMVQAEKSTRSVSDAIHNTARDVDGFGKTLSRFGEAAVAGYGLYKLENLLRQAFDAFSEAEVIGARLTATLDANGRAVDDLTEQYKDFAEQMESMSSIEDDHVLSLLRQAETFEVTGTAAQKAVRDAVALAAVTGGQAESLIRLTAALAKGDIEQAMRFARMVPQLRGIKDQSEFVAKAQHLIASGVKAASAEMETASGVLQLLHRDYKNLLEDVGEVISEVVKPLAKFAREVIAAFRGLDPEVKKTLAIVLLVTAALMSIGPAIASFRATGLPALRMMADGFQIIATVIKFLFQPTVALAALWKGLVFVTSLVLGPWGLAIVAIVALIGILITKTGGITKALEFVQHWAVKAWNAFYSAAEKAFDFVIYYARAFISWFTPIWRALVDLAIANWQNFLYVVGVVWDAIKDMATVAGEWIMAVWDYVTDGAQLNWDAIRKYIMTAIIGAEYLILNFGKISKLVWAGIKWSAVAFANYLLNNVFLVMMGPGGWLVMLLRKLNIDWQAVFTTIYDFTRNMFSQLGGAAGRLASTIYNAIRGRTTDGSVAETMGRIAGQALNGMEVTFSGINLPSLNRLEAQLKQEFMELGAAVGEDFQVFLARRLTELGLGITPQMIKDNKKKAGELGNAIAEGLGKPLERLEGTLAGSMEHMSRILESRQRFMDKGNPTPRVEGEAAGIIAPILRTIAEHTRRMAAAPAVRIAPAGLEG